MTETPIDTPVVRPRARNKVASQIPSRSAEDSGEELRHISVRGGKYFRHNGATYSTCARKEELCVQPAFFERLLQWAGTTEDFQPQLDSFADGKRVFRCQQFYKTKTG